MNKCIFCKREPKIVKICDIYYVQCACKKHRPFDYIGITVKNAIKQWNDNNPIPIEEILDDDGEPFLIPPKQKRIRPWYIVDGKTFKAVYLVSSHLSVSPKTIYNLFQKTEKDTVYYRGHKIKKILQPKEEE